MFRHGGTDANHRGVGHDADDGVFVLRAASQVGERYLGVCADATEGAGGALADFFVRVAEEAGEVGDDLLGLVPKVPGGGASDGADVGFGVAQGFAEVGKDGEGQLLTALEMDELQQSHAVAQCPASPEPPNGARVVSGCLRSAGTSAAR